MSLVKSYNFYSLSKQNLLKKDYNSSCWFGYNCWEQIRDCFDDLEDTQQAFCLKLLYQTSLTMVQSLLESGKDQEALIYLDKIKNNFYDISEFGQYSGATRKISTFYMKKVDQEHNKLLK